MSLAGGRCVRIGSLAAQNASQRLPAYAKGLSNISLSFAISLYDRVLPLIAGEIRPSGIVLEYEPNPSPSRTSPVPRLFFEQIKYQRYDVSEMSFSSFLIERAKGWPYVALPVFHNRNFRYAGIVVRDGSGIRQDCPEDLKGKRMSVPDYQMSMALWTRGILQHEFGILPRDLQWFQARGERFSHTGASRTQLPEGVQLTFANTAEADLFKRDAVDASITLDAATPGVSTLFSDPRAEAIRFYRKTGIFPPHHITVVRESIVQAQPWVALSLVDAFQAAKAIAMRRLRDQSLLVFNQTYVQTERALFGEDPWVYGVKANAAAIDMVQTISVEQGLTTRKAPLEDVFPESVLIADESTIGL
jgi:4,5-dihydroxyphthalate decarboxylase